MKIMAPLNHVILANNFTLQMLYMEPGTLGPTGYKTSLKIVLPTGQTHQICSVFFD